MEAMHVEAIRFCLKDAMQAPHCGLVPAESKAQLAPTASQRSLCRQQLIKVDFGELVNRGLYVLPYSSHIKYLIDLTEQSNSGTQVPPVSARIPAFTATRVSDKI
jgi:hypothetical protein